MMNKLQLFIFLVCICMLAGCTEEEENSGIRLIEGTASGQTVFADETTTDGDIHFTADGAWTAEVTEASIISCGCQRWILYGLLHDDNNALAIILPQEYNCNEEVV